MLGTHDLQLFIAAGLLLNITPGADTLYIVGRASTQGLRAGLVAALGIGAGCLVHILATAVGLAALLATSAQAFMWVKLLGAAYLAYLGLTLLMTKANQPTIQTQPTSASLNKVFWGGFLTNVLNPKVALFFLAFLPQFIEPHAPSKSLSLVFLGVLFDINGTLWNLFIAWVSATAATQLKLAASISTWLKRMCGLLFLYFAANLLKAEL